MLGICAATQRRTAWAARGFWERVSDSAAVSTTNVTGCDILGPFVDTPAFSRYLPHKEKETSSAEPPRRSPTWAVGRVTDPSRLRKML